MNTPAMMARATTATIRYTSKAKHSNIDVGDGFYGTARPGTKRDQIGCSVRDTT
jgi:hypothetical protein